MGATGIEWTIGPNGEPGFTFNPWIGCTKILGPHPELSACLNCYAESASVKFGSPWGPHADRRGVSESTWLAPYAWDRRARRERRRFRVFSGSMCDILDNHRSILLPWRQRLYETVEGTPNLDWLFLTKRPMNGERLLPPLWTVRAWPRNLWFGVTVENQEAADARLPYLRAFDQAPVRFLSVEPMMGRLVLPPDAADFIDWVICGGESGRLAAIRDTPDEWMDDLQRQCGAMGIPFFRKQLPQLRYRAIYKKFDRWPEHYQVRQHPTPRRLAA